MATKGCSLVAKQVAQLFRLFCVATRKEEFFRLVFPHHLHVDAEGNVWVADSRAATEAELQEFPEAAGKGHQVIKFSPEGKVPMVLGTPRELGSKPNHFGAPSDVAVAENGDVFIPDGHNAGGNNRVVNFSSDGKFLTALGRMGWGPGEFQALHAIASGPRGRIFLGDRDNDRMQIFDQDANFEAIWSQFGKSSGIAFGGDGRICIADSESDHICNP